MLFYLRNQRANTEGSPIMMRVTLNGVQSRLSVQRRIPKSYWNPSRGEVKRSFEGATSINLHLELLRSQAYQAYSKLERTESYYTAQHVTDLMQGKTEGRFQPLVAFWDAHNEGLKLQIGKTVSKALWRKHNSALNHLTSFLLLQYGTSELPVSKVSKMDIHGFYKYLIEHAGHAHNTAIKNMQFLKKIILLALDQGILSQNPFASFPLSLKSVERPFLTQDELEVLVEKQFRIKRLAFIKDIFVFSCYTGLAFIDVCRLKKSEILKTPDGVCWIKTLRSKTKVRSQIPLLEIPLEIIRRYADLERLGAEDNIFKVPSNQKVNGYLKEVADLCGIEKNLTFHMARHTFATTVTLQNGVPIESVSKMLGHTNISTTQHYAKVLDSKIYADLLQMSNRSRLNMGRS